MKDLKDAHSERLKASQQFFDEKMRAEANNHQEVRDKGAEIVANGKSHIRDIELLHIQRVQQLGEYYNEKYQEKQENLARVSDNFFLLIQLLFVN